MGPGTWLGVVLLLGAAACLPAPGPVPALAVSGPVPFDAVIALEFGVPLDPACLTARSLLVEDGAGRPLAHEARLRGERVEVALVVDAGWLSDPPSQVVFTLPGAPSVHAWRSSTGALLESSRRLTCALLPTPSPDGPRPPRLVAVAGVPVGAPGERRFAQDVELVFEGRLDPATLVPGSFPLFVEPQGSGFPPSIPAVRWQAVGTRTTVLLTPPGDQLRRFELRTRALGVADRAGRSPEPLVKLALLRTD